MTGEQSRSDYAVQIERENRLADDRRADISRRLADGTLSVRKAASEWIEVAERNLAALQLFREMTFGTDAGRPG